MTKNSEPMVEPTPLSEEGGVFSALKDLGTAGLSPARISSGAEVLSAHIAEKGGLAASSSASASTAGASGLGKILIVLLGIPLVVAAWWVLRTTPSQQSAPDTEPVVVIAFDAGLPVDAFVLDASVVPHSVVSADAASKRGVLADAAGKQIRTATPRKLVPPDAGPRKLVPPDAAPPASQLPAQLRLLKEAKELARSGDHKQALQRLADLESQFPNTPLGAEVDLRRAVILSASGNLKRAATAIRALLNDPRHSGRVAELHHMLVDILLQRDRCDLAQASLNAAIAAGLGASRREKAEAGVARCRALAGQKEKK